MKLTPDEQKICKKYSTPDDTGHVHCYECPLHFGDPKQWDFRCKANCKYDPKINDYEWEDWYEEQ